MACSMVCGRCSSSSMWPRISVGRERAADLREVEAEQLQRHELRREGLGGRHADLGPGVGVDRAVGVARRRAAHDVADGDAAGALARGLVQRRQRVGRLARLRDDDRELVRRRRSGCGSGTRSRTRPRPAPAPAPRSCTCRPGRRATTCRTPGSITCAGSAASPPGCGGPRGRSRRDRARRGRGWCRARRSAARRSP